MPFSGPHMHALGVCFPTGNSGVTRITRTLGFGQALGSPKRRQIKSSFDREEATCVIRNGICRHNVTVQLLRYRLDQNCGILCKFKYSHGCQRLSEDQLAVALRHTLQASCLFRNLNHFVLGHPATRPI